MNFYYTIKKYNHPPCETTSSCNHNTQLIEHKISAYEAKRAIVQDAFVFHKFEDVRSAIAQLKWSNSHIGANYSVDGFFIPTSEDREYVTGFVCEVAA